MNLVQPNNKNVNQEKNPEYLKDIKEIKKNNRVTIIGFAPSLSEVEWGLDDMDYWGINELYMETKGKKFTAWFETHDINKSPSKQAKFHQDFLKRCKLPLVTLQHWDKFPMSMPYPRQEVKKMVNESYIIENGGGGYSDYSNQIAWMLALAIYLDYKEIHLYGVDMAQESEYMFQRPACQYFLGLAAGRGIKLKVPASCELLKGRGDYGFDTDNKNRHRKKSRIKSVKEQIRRLSIRQAEIKYWVDKVLEPKIEKARIVAEEKMKEIMSVRATAKTQQQLDHLAGLEKKINEEYSLVEKDTYVNIQILMDEYEKNEKSIKTMEGLIQECNHDLNNNLV